jgi:hypothetical protein
MDIDSETKYLTYTPWQGDLNNTRMCFETCLILAYLSRRCLVLPREYRREDEPEVEAGKFRPLHPSQCFEFDVLEKTVPLIARAEFDRRVTGAGRGDWVDLTLEPGTAVFCFPRIPAPDSLERERLLNFAAGRQRFLEITPAMEKCRTLTLNSGTLEHFYTFFYCSEPRVALECKRLVRDHLRFKLAILKAAASIAAALGDYCAVHVRRNDFFTLYPEQNIPASRLLCNVMTRVPAGARLYIASDERDRGFFNDLRPYYEVRFLEDVKSLLPSDMHPASLACVEQMVCAHARLFVGTRLSTFSGYITRLRGYHGAADRNSYFTDGSPGSELDDLGLPAFSWINWLKMGYPLWGREFREGWEF